MFFVHPAVAWMTPEAKADGYFQNFMRFSGMIAPTFMFLAGLSVAIVLSRADAAGKPPSESRRRVARRGIQILLIGYGLHFLMYTLGGAWGPVTRALKVDILHCIGLSMAVLPWTVRPKKTVNFIALFLTVALPFLSMFFYRLPIGENLPTYIAGYLTSRTDYTLFPPIPYAAWMTFGLFFGPIFLRGTANGGRGELRFWLLTAAAALLIWYAGKGIKILYYAHHLDTWAVSSPQVKGVPHFFWMKGTVVLATLGAARLSAPLLDRIPFRFWVLFGRHSLFAYCAHLLIVYPIAGVYLAKRLSPSEHFLASSALTAVMLLSVLGIERFPKIRASTLLAAIRGRRNDVKDSR